jgi:hypothetical protein
MKQWIEDIVTVIVIVPIMILVFIGQGIFYVLDKFNIIDN